MEKEVQWLNKNSQTCRERAKARISDSLASYPVLPVQTWNPYSSSYLYRDDTLHSGHEIIPLCCCFDALLLAEGPTATL